MFLFEINPFETSFEQMLLENNYPNLALELKIVDSSFEVLTVQINSDFNIQFFHFYDRLVCWFVSSIVIYLDRYSGRLL